MIANPASGYHISRRALPIGDGGDVVLTSLPVMSPADTAKQGIAMFGGCLHIDDHT